MANVKFLLTQGIGLSPDSVKYIVTDGLGIAEVEMVHPAHIQKADHFYRLGSVRDRYSLGAARNRYGLGTVRTRHNLGRVK